MPLPSSGEGSPRVNAWNSILSARSERASRIGDDHGRMHAAPGDPHLPGIGECRVLVDTAKREHGHPECPQAEPADTRFAGGNEQREAQRIREVQTGDCHQMQQTRDELGSGSTGGKCPQVESDRTKDILRQPACAPAMVVPYVLENVRHLQSLSEGDRQREKLPPPFANLRRVVAKQFGEHFADHPCDVVAISIEMGQVGQTFDRGTSLKLRHASGHDAHATNQGVALDGTKSVGNANDFRSVGDQIMLAVEHCGGQQRPQLPREAVRRLTARDDFDKELPECLLLRH